MAVTPINSEDRLVQAIFAKHLERVLGWDSVFAWNEESRELLASIKAHLEKHDRFWEKEQTKADVRIFILDQVYTNLPTPPFTPEEKQAVAAEVYTHVWQQAVRGEFAMAA